jgi:hypothetical protein
MKKLLGYRVEIVYEVAHTVFVAVFPGRKSSGASASPHQETIERCDESAMWLAVIFEVAKPSCQLPRVKSLYMVLIFV